VAGVVGGEEEEIPRGAPAQGTGGTREAAQREQRRRRILRRRLGTTRFIQTVARYDCVTRPECG